MPLHKWKKGKSYTPPSGWPVYSAIQVTHTPWICLPLCDLYCVCQALSHGLVLSLLGVKPLNFLWCLDVSRRAPQEACCDSQCVSSVTRVRLPCSNSGSEGALKEQHLGPSGPVSPRILQARLWGCLMRGGGVSRSAIAESRR